MPRSRPATTSAAGFTLIEMLIIAPMVILMIAGFIAIMINMSGRVLVDRERNQAVADMQAALDRIEGDVRLTAKFQTSTGTVPSPMGSDNGTAAFTNSGNRLLLSNFLTTRNPVDQTTSYDLVYIRNSPNPCTDSDPNRSFTYNTPFTGHTVYFVADGSLYRRSIVPAGPPNGLCGQTWQRNSCTTGSGGACVSRDERVLDDITSIAVHYYQLPSSTTALSASGAEQAQTIEVTLSTSEVVAGANINHNATLRATRLNSPTSS